MPVDMEKYTNEELSRLNDYAFEIMELRKRKEEIDERLKELTTEFAATACPEGISGTLALDDCNASVSFRQTSKVDEEKFAAIRDDLSRSVVDECFKSKLSFNQSAYGKIFHNLSEHDKILVDSCVTMSEPYPVITFKAIAPKENQVPSM